jgi:transposase-like protein
MIGVQDVQKRRAWEGRLERFRASGLTVARFCEQEGVSPHTLYYWSKRIEISSARPSARSSKSPLTRQLVKQSPMTDGISNAAVVRFSWNAVEVSVPADCLAAIRCLAECFHSQHTQERCDSFQEVVVRS